MAKSAMNNTRLAIIFVVLMAIVGATQFFDWGKKERTFRKELVNIDTASIQTITLTPKNQNKPITFKPVDESWTVSQGDIQAPADDNQVTNMLSTLNGLEVSRVAATEQAKWQEYEVTDSLGAQLRLDQADASTMTLMVGKFNMNRQTRSATSFVRVSGDEKVYAVEGFLSTTFNRQFSDWRNKTVVEGDKANWNTLRFSYQSDSSFTLQQEDGSWMVGDQPADSASLQNYFNKVGNLTSTAFRNNFEATDKEAFAKLIIQRADKDNIKVRSYGSAQQPVIHSSQNPESYFDGSEQDLYQKLFTGRDQLLAIEDTIQ